MAKRQASKKSKSTKKTNSKNKRTARKKTTGGKKHPSGYQMFCAEQRQNSQFETMKPTEIMKHLGAEWRNLSPQQQEVYKMKASSKTSNQIADKDELKSQGSQIHKSLTKSQSHSKSISQKIPDAKSASRKAVARETDASESSHSMKSKDRHI